MPTLPPIATVPLFARCRWCAGVFRTATSWPVDPQSRYRRCRWCSRLTPLPERARGMENPPLTSRVVSGGRGV